MKILLATAFCGAMVGGVVAFNQVAPVAASAEATATVEVDPTQGATAKTYADLLAVVNEGVAEEEQVQGSFTMTKGASVRINKNTPGIRFQANFGDSIAAVKEAYADYTFNYYVYFTANNGTEDGSLYVETTLDEAKNAYTASLTFADLGDQFNAYKAMEISGEGVMVLTKGEDKIVVKADANDNTRTMEGVVNKAKQVGEFDRYDDTIKAAMNAFIPGYNTSADKLYIEGANALDQVKANYAEGEVSAVYVGAKKLDNETDLVSAMTAGTLSEDYVTVVDSQGNFTNRKYFYADTVIRKPADLAKVYSETATSTINGYFVVANDILWGETAEEQFTAKPHCADWGWLNTTSKFGGTFDGDGHKIEYGIQRAGLFGTLASGATVKNAQFIVKAYTSTSNANRSYAHLVVLANYLDSATVKNVYAKYDFDLTPDFTKTGNAGNGAKVTHKVGLVNMRNYGSIVDVIVDMSRVSLTNIGQLSSTSGDPGYGIFGYMGRYLGSQQISEFNFYTTNSYVIWENEEIAVQATADGTKVWLASEDGESLDGYVYAGTYTNVKRYATVAEMAEKVNYVGNFDFEDGKIIWVPSQS